MSNEQVVRNDQRTKGRQAHIVSIDIAVKIGDLLRSTLGPKGMDKMLVDQMGDIVVTNDGVTILNEMNIDNPTAKIIVEVARTQESEVGDGTTTAVVLSSELLRRAGMLISKNIHPTVIAKGYKIARDEAIQFLKENSLIVDSEITDNKRVYENIVNTAITGKGAEEHKDLLVSLIVGAVNAIESLGKEKTIRDDIVVVGKVGASVEDSELIKGIVLDKERFHPSMPEKISGAKIALLDFQLKNKEYDGDMTFNVNQIMDIENIMKVKDKEIEDLVQKVLDSGANVVMCGRGIDDMAGHLLAKNGILAVKTVAREDLQRISKATGAKMLQNIESLDKNSLGESGMVEEVKIGLTKVVAIRECPNPESITILVKGSTDKITDEIKRAVEDSVGDLVTVSNEKRVLGGAGAPEIMLYEHLKGWSTNYEGRIQLAIDSYAEAMLAIPESLAENAGLDSIDVVAKMKANLASKSFKFPGIDVFTGEVMDSVNEGIIEPLKVKTQALTSATEVAIMILRIDDIIATNPDPNKQAKEMQ